ncbi:MAG: hypothetical protein ABIG95_02570 [Candidatus Woesearchaeota archaeon]
MEERSLKELSKSEIIALTLRIEKKIKKIFFEQNVQIVNDRYDMLSLLQFILLGIREGLFENMLTEEVKRNLVK